MWTRLLAEGDQEEEDYPEVRRRLRGKQPPRQAEGREGASEAAAEVEGDLSATQAVALIDLFGGVSSMRVAALASGYKLVAHDYVEIYGNAVKVVKAWFPDASRLGDIRSLASNPQVYAKAFWHRVRPTGVAFVLLGAGFPCRELSQVNQSRRGLDKGDTARFQEAKILFKALLDCLLYTSPSPRDS